MIRIAVEAYSIRSFLDSPLFWFPGIVVVVEDGIVVVGGEVAL